MYVNVDDDEDSKVDEEEEDNLEASFVEEEQKELDDEVVDVVGGEVNVDVDLVSVVSTLLCDVAGSLLLIFGLIHRLSAPFSKNLE